MKKKPDTPTISGVKASAFADADKVVYRIEAEGYPPLDLKADTVSASRFAQQILQAIRDATPKTMILTPGGIHIK